MERNPTTEWDKETMQYRRSQAKGATFFFTVVTHKRKMILCHDANVALIKEASQYVSFPEISVLQGH